MILRKSFRGFCLSASCAACSTFEPCVVLSSEIKLHADLCLLIFIVIIQKDRHGMLMACKRENGREEILY